MSSGASGSGRGGAGRPRRPGAVSAGSAVTNRAAILAVVLCAVVVMVAYPLQQYVAQRAAIGRAERANAAAQSVADGLASQEALWSDPAYVEAQARARLHYGKPGEIVYQIDGGSQSAASSAAGAGPLGLGGEQPAIRQQPVAPAQPWFRTLWDSMQSAGAPAGDAASSPSGPGPAAGR